MQLRLVPTWFLHQQVAIYPRNWIMNKAARLPVDYVYHFSFDIYCFSTTKMPANVASSSQGKVRKFLPAIFFAQKTHSQLLFPQMQWKGWIYFVTKKQVGQMPRRITSVCISAAAEIFNPKPFSVFGYSQQMGTDNAKHVPESQKH